ncbi:MULTISPECIES: hypothetical protein [Nocardiopsis]|uniref:hypothetical protein n=1 Tax=Nocardiopsis TaxID=2013 RepID=UPI000345324E|nr:MULTISPECIES: hypothetical protein [Nocardiopsis]
MSLALLFVGAVLIAVAVSNRVVRFFPAVAVLPARLTEAGRATLTTVGGSALIIAFFLALSGI